MSNNLYMPLHPADYLTDTAHLSAAEHGAYLLLIMNYWQRGEPLPADERKLRVIARMTPDEWAASRDLLLEFFNECDGVLCHQRIDAELAKAREKSAKAQASALAKGASPKRPQSIGKADAERTLGERNANQDQLQDQNIKGGDSAPARDAAMQFRLDVVDAYRRAGLMQTPDGGYTAIWLARGHDPAICLAVIAEGLHKLGRFVPLNYFDRQIADAHVAPAARASPAHGPPVRDKRSPIVKAAANIAKDLHNESARNAQIVELVPAFAGASSHGPGGGPHGQRYRA